jgi:hypothetical protein
MQHFVICSPSSSAHLVNLLRRLPATGGKLDNLLHLLARLLWQQNQFRGILGLNRENGQILGFPS